MIILHSYHFPVAIVEIKNPTKTPEPSIAVRIVREFIRKELGDKSKYIRFECLGPSPFHLNCYFNPQKIKLGDTWIFNPVEELEIGYDKLIINYNENIIKDSDGALDYLIFSIGCEFGFYYKYEQIRNSKINSWKLIQENLGKLIQIQKASGIEGFYKKFFGKSALIKHLITDIAMFEGQDIFDNASRQNDYNETYYIKDEAFFKTFIDRELKEKINYPIKQTTDLITFFESRRIKKLELIIVIIAAILGGAIGVLTTIYLQYGQNPISKP